MRKKKPIPRQDLYLDAVIVEAAGRKAFDEGFELRQYYILAPFLNYLMQRYINGEFDDVLSSVKRLDVRTNVIMDRFAVRKDLKIAFENKAFEDEKIRRHCHSKVLMEKILSMYVEGKITLKSTEDE